MKWLAALAIAAALAAGAAYFTRATDSQEINHQSPAAAVFPVVSTTAESPSQGTILLGGDLMFDRTVREFGSRYGDDYLLSCLDPVLSDANLVVANLEGPITDSASVSEGSVVGSSDNYVFTFPPTTAGLLARHRISLVSLGNNHIENFGTAGVESTIQYLQYAGERYFGDPIANSVATVEVGDVPVAFINYNEFIPQGGTASTTFAQIAQARAQGSVPIVYAHWGVEYATTSPQRIIDLAHRFVDAGAMAVIGSHPHVVEQSEIYKGAPIYYSLGNLIFDQYFSEAVMHGLMVELSVAPSRVTVAKEIPVVLSTDHRTCPAS